MYLSKLTTKTIILFLPLVKNMVFSTGSPICNREVDEVSHFLLEQFAQLPVKLIWAFEYQTFQFGKVFSNHDDHVLSSQLGLLNRNFSQFLETF